MGTCFCTTLEFASHEAMGSIRTYAYRNNAKCNELKSKVIWFKTIFKCCSKSLTGGRLRRLVCVKPYQWAIKLLHPWHRLETKRQ
uniref:Uncharacterized protein n=1 Tax=Pararge aegeria TaxID=116150 RepID=S4PF04_9NEOP